MAPRRSARRTRIAICHPDLGLGGAERLIVDVADELAERGYQVDIWTAYYDSQRCFEETKNGSFGVVVAGAWFPRSIGGRGLAICAYIRCILMALSLFFTAWRTGKWPDLVIVDQVSACVPVLRVLLRRPVLFYCHFPDLLLAKPASALHRAYRRPLDWLEQETTGAANLVVVNSRFTKGVFAKTFARLDARGMRPAVLYPAVAVPSAARLAGAAASWEIALPPELVTFIKAHHVVILSINRFERKKNIPLVLRAFALARQRMQKNSGMGLVIAGGYDARLPENVEYLEELRVLAWELGINEHVAFLPSFSDHQRDCLLARATAVAYTPAEEHFGIVPLEAGAAGRAVLACDSGGPLESIVDGQTGLLRPPQPEAWADALQALTRPGAADKLGGAAAKRVAAEFSRKAFGDRLETLVQQLVEGVPGRSQKETKKRAA